VPKRRFCGQRINGQVTGEITIKHYSIKFPEGSLATPNAPMAGSATMTGVTPKISWDERVTTINQAILRCSAHAYCNFHDLVTVYWKFNNQLVVSRQNYPCSEMGNPEGTNVGAYLINGEENTMFIELTRLGLFQVGIDHISADLEIWFQGKPPTVTYPEPEWMQYVKWGAVAAVILAGVYIGVKAYESRKKKG